MERAGRESSTRCMSNRVPSLQMICVGVTSPRVSVMATTVT